MSNRCCGQALGGSCAIRHFWLLLSDGTFLKRCVSSFRRCCLAQPHGVFGLAHLAFELDEEMRSAQNNLWEESFVEAIVALGLDQPADVLVPGQCR
jgi:hypothetical protein